MFCYEYLHILFLYSVVVHGITKVKGLHTERPIFWVFPITLSYGTNMAMTFIPPLKK